MVRVSFIFLFFAPFSCGQNGQLDSPGSLVKNYRPSGQLISEWREDPTGKIQGIAKWYYLTGEDSVQETYVDGQLQGPTKTFYKNGTLMIEGAYVNGKSEGEFRFYDLRHKIQQIQYYSDDELGAVSFFKNSKIIKMESYDLNNKSINTVVIIKPNGSLDKKMSRFANILFWDNDSIRFELIGPKTPYDSAVVQIISDFGSKKVIRSERFGKEGKIGFKIDHSDYLNDRLSILTTTYKMTKPNFFEIEEYKIQLMKNKKYPPYYITGVM